MSTTATETRSWVPELTFGARLALVRRAKGWNMKEAAANCGLPAQSWRQWEVAGHLPRRYVQVAKQIAGATGVDYHWLVFGPEGGGGGGGVEFKGRYNALAERPIVRRSHVKSSSVQPTRRRAKPLRSPNRVELVAA